MLGLIADTDDDDGDDEMMLLSVRDEHQVARNLEQQLERQHEQHRLRMPWQARDGIDLRQQPQRLDGVAQVVREELVRMRRVTLCHRTPSSESMAAIHSAIQLRVSLRTKAEQHVHVVASGTTGIPRGLAAVDQRRCLADGA